jgi:threonine dehydratase
MSGGGLIAGVAAAVKQARPSIRVIGVEPAGAARMTASLAAGHPVTLDRIDSIADGLLAVRPGEIPFRHVKAFVDRVVTVEDEATVEAMRWLFTHARIVAEPSGAITVAAVRADAERAAGAGLAAPWGNGAVVAVVSGGNVERSAFLRYLE